MDSTEQNASDKGQASTPPATTPPATSPTPKKARRKRKASPKPRFAVGVLSEKGVFTSYPNVEQPDETVTTFSKMLKWMASMEKKGKLPSNVSLNVALLYPQEYFVERHETTKLVCRGAAEAKSEKPE